MTQVLCVDFGSTFTKAVLLDPSDGRLLAQGSVPTSVGTDILDGYRLIIKGFVAQGFSAPDEVLACSSAGGGLRLAVVGYERSVTVEAGRRVGLSAGAKVVHVAAGPMTTQGLATLRATRPDVILLVGGTDGGNAEVLLHNGSRLAKARMGAAVVVAGNIEAQAEVVTCLESTGRRFVLTDNVLPEIGVINPDGARAAIRQVFLRHVIGGKGLSKGPEFASMIRAATPDAMLRGVELLATTIEGDVLLFDIGGATTDVYSVVGPVGEDAGLRKDVVAPLWHARTVEGDLGMRWNAGGVVDAARAEHLLSGTALEQLKTWAAGVEADPAYLPNGAGEVELDMTLALVASLTAVRRHARPTRLEVTARPLTRVAHVIGSGGVLRNIPELMRNQVLRAVTTDFSGGWKVPTEARTTVDSAYLLFAVGLLAEADGLGPEVAARVAARVLG
jgi:uncharacterized protein (TIGR01319 family)